MAKLIGDLEGGATVELSDGSKLRIAGLTRASELQPEDVRNVVGALLELINNLDNRLAGLEQRQAIDQMRRCEVARAI
jgi:hypothetical protein